MWERAFMPERGAGAATAPAARKARWCNGSAAFIAVPPSTVPSAAENVTKPNNSTDAARPAAGGAVVAGIVAAVEVGQASGTGAAALVNGLAPAVPEIGLDVALGQAGPSV